jgi:hypothetical protein
VVDQGNVEKYVRLVGDFTSGSFIVACFLTSFQTKIQRGTS